MHPSRCVLFLLFSGAQAFLIHNVHRSLCLEELPDSGEVVARACRLDSDRQQWIWEERSRLVNMASSRCLSAHEAQRVHTQPCPEVGEGDRTRTVQWDCDRDRLISRNNSLKLSLSGRRVVLTDDSKNIRWRSVDKGDVCQETLRSRRASEEFEVVPKPTMSAQEKEYLRWFYRTESPTYWKFALLGLAFICLLIGFMLLGMGAMANKNRKKIAKYKAAAAILQKKDCEELRVLSVEEPSVPTTPTLQAKPPNGELSDSRPGDILLTYKDGNTSSLYPEPPADTTTAGEEEEQGGEKEEEVKVVQEDRPGEEEGGEEETKTAEPESQEEQEEVKEEVKVEE